MNFWIGFADSTFILLQVNENLASSEKTDKERMLPGNLTSPTVLFPVFRANFIKLGYVESVTRESAYAVRCQQKTGISSYRQHRTGASQLVMWQIILLLPQASGYFKNYSQVFATMSTVCP